MATLREVRARISGVKKTQKITKAMKMVAAAKLRRAQVAVVSARPYARTMREVLQHLCAGVDAVRNPMIVPREVRAVAIVVVTGDRGLCGAFNANVSRAAIQHIRANYSALQVQGKLSLFCVGKKGFDTFVKQHYKIAGKHIGIFGGLNFGTAQQIAREVVEGYARGEYDKVEVVYNEFKSIAQQRIVVEQYLPIPTSELSQAEETPHSYTNYLYEPSSRELIDLLVPKHLNFQMWRVLLESNAAEQGARMAAMDNATENANEMISELQLVYNKARQASITKELLEVVSGAEALKTAG